MSEISTNREYKDRLFKFLFGNEAFKENALSLYNAIHNTSYTDPNDLTFNTLEDVVFMNMKNDISFLIDSHMSLYEHQSTYNANMPLRGLMYFSRLFEKYVNANKLNWYRSSPIKLPTPRFIVFYNGTEEHGETEKLCLSESFDFDGDIEVFATMVNINYGHNKELMERCKPLEEYAIFVDKMRTCCATMDIGEAIKTAIDDCIAENVMADILDGFRSEVEDLLLTEYNEEQHLAIVREEGKAEGREEGKAEGREEGKAEGREEGKLLIVLDLISKGLLPKETGAEELGISLEELEEERNAFSENN